MEEKDMPDFTNMDRNQIKNLTAAFKGGINEFHTNLDMTMRFYGKSTITSEIISEVMAISRGQTNLAEILLRGNESRKIDRDDKSVIEGVVGREIYPSLAEYTVKSGESAIAVFKGREIYPSLAEYTGLGISVHSRFWELEFNPQNILWWDTFTPHKHELLKRKTTYRKVVDELLLEADNIPWTRRVSGFVPQEKISKIKSEKKRYEKDPWAQSKKIQ